MFKGNIVNATAITANTNIPFNVVWNTNTNTKYNSATNEIEIKQAGYYNVNAMFVVSGSTPTTVSVQLFANGLPIADAVATADITATTGIQTLNITDTIRVSRDLNDDYLGISARLVSSATIDTGNITVEKVR